MSSARTREYSLLIVEDDKSELATYMTFAAQLGLKVLGVGSLSDALTELSKTAFDVVLTDLHLTPFVDEADGLSLLKHIKEEHPTVAALAMSSDPNIDLYEKAMGLSALYFIRKPIINADEIAIAIDFALERRRLRTLEKKGERALLLNDALQKICPEGIVISARDRKLVERSARRPDIPILVTGETGTGKEEIAKLIHRKRCQSDGPIPFVAVNCANLSEDLMVSALFGHKKGSFSGAQETTTGYVGEADGGILFLDEIHTLSRACQQKLLRVLNDGSYQRLGDTKTLYSSFQVICATTHDLDEEVDNGAFLLDLRTRLIGIEIGLLPLRERFDELPLFLSLFFAKASVKPDEIEFQKLVAKCREYYWRGNIRQLYRVLNLLVSIAEEHENRILAQQLPILKTMFPPGMEGKGSSQVVVTQNEVALKVSDLGVEVFKPLESDLPFHEAVEKYEKLILEKAIARHSHNFSKVCLGLKMGRSSLDLKRKKYGLS